MGRSLFVYLSVCFSCRCKQTLLLVELITGGNTSSHLTRVPPEAIPRYPANLPPEAVREFSTLQIYRRRPSVNILCQAMREHLYPANLPPEAN
jgi:hypothetical protein